jgi:hypothetical protein
MIQPTGGKIPSGYNYMRVGKPNSVCTQCKRSTAKDPLWEDVSMVNPTTIPNVPELYYWEGKILIRMYCHQVGSNCRLGARQC